MTEAEPKAGRPVVLLDGKRVTVTLDAQTIEQAKALGAGNLSRGLRKGLEIAAQAQGKADEETRI